MEATFPILLVTTETDVAVLLVTVDVGFLRLWWQEQSFQGQLALWVHVTLVETPWFLQKLQKCGPTSTKESAQKREKNCFALARNGHTVFCQKDTICHLPSAAHRKLRATRHSILKILIFTTKTDHGYFCWNLTLLVCYLHAGMGLKEIWITKEISSKKTLIPASWPVREFLWRNFQSIR